MTIIAAGDGGNNSDSLSIHKEIRVHLCHPFLFVVKILWRHQHHGQTWTPASRPSTGFLPQNGRPAIVSVVSRQAWITGTHQHTLEPSDPYPGGYRLSDTWPMQRRS